MSKDLDYWNRYQAEKANAKAVSDPTPDSDPSEGGNGSEASESTVSNDSRMSSGDSAVVEDTALVDTLVEAIKTKDEDGKKLLRKMLQKRKAKFLKGRTTKKYIAWKIKSSREKRVGIRHRNRRRLR